MPKRARESTGVDTALVEIWEDLAHEDERLRIKAAHRLLTQHIPNAQHDQLLSILRRLFRGLCSSRKAARLGFSIALTETLTYLKEHRDIASPNDVLQTLESQTVPEANTSGQDERDHYFGRLFGSDAVIKSGLLFDKAEFGQWEILLDLVCGVSIKKPWLRQECGWILFNCVKQLSQGSNLDGFAVQIIERLTFWQLIRTPEGLAIWIEVQRAFPNAKLAKKVWKHDDPLTAKEAPTLAKVLMDVKSTKDGDEDGVQGSATWSGQLHFVWDVVLSELMKDVGSKQRVKFVDFWKSSVDDGLFAPTSSRERKHWGLMVLQKAFASTSSDHLPACFSRNAVSCLMQSLKDSDSYLKRSAQKAVQALQNRFKASQGEIPVAVAGILIASDMTDFDAFTKTKTLETWFSLSGTDELTEITTILKGFLCEPDTDDAVEATSRRKNILNIQYKLFCAIASKSVPDQAKVDLAPLAQILESWMLSTREVPSATAGTTPSSPRFSETTTSYIRERLSLAFEQALKIGRQGQALVLKCISTLKKKEGNKPFFPEADEAINEVVSKGWLRFSQLQQEAYGESSSDPASKIPKPHSKKSDKKSNGISMLIEKSQSQDERQTNSTIEGVALLYGLTMFQVYNDDVEAISVLGDLLEFEEQAGTVKNGNDSKTTGSFSTDGLVEIILSFASRPSKFLRRMTLEIFASFTSQISQEGLQSLIEILETKETKAGQEQLFQPNDTEADGDDIDGEDDSDVEMLDSDVDVVSEAEGSTTSENDSNEEEESDEEGSDGGNEEREPQDDELAKLEASLAAALGTRKLTTSDLNGDSSTSSDDSDMTDSEMMALDEKLADVFRAQAANASKKNDQKSAKENIINFKNRVLDMIEVYLRCEVYQNPSKQPNPNSLQLLLPLLSLSRKTSTKQLSTRALELVKTFCTKCKGLGNVPTLFIPKEEVKTNGIDKKSKSKSKSKKSKVEDSEDEVNHVASTLAETTTLLQGIHVEASLPNTSNAHKATCSQASLLVVKVLVKSGAEIDGIVGVYADTRTRMLLDPSCHVSERFFVDWGNWCGSVKGKLGKEREE